MFPPVFHWLTRPAPGLPVAAELLQHFDLISVRIFDEEEPRDLLTLAVELDDLARLEALGLEAAMLRVKVVDNKGDMAIAGAEFVGFRAALVDRQFDLERRLGVREISEREVGEIEPVGDVEPEGLLVEGKRPRLVQHADHHVDRLRHLVRSRQRPPPSGDAPGAMLASSDTARVLSAYYSPGRI